MTAATQTLLERLRQTDWGALPLPAVGRAEWEALRLSLDHQAAICLLGLSTLRQQTGRQPDEMVVVDFGGGAGLASMIMKTEGVGTVLYADSRPEALETATAVQQAVGVAADRMWLADASRLQQCCAEAQLVPDALLGLDVIDKVYGLDDFFSHLFALRPQMPMWLTTYANIYNRRQARQQRREMVKDECTFRDLRRAFLAQQFADLSEAQLDYWAENTRGLDYDDMLRAVESHTPNLLRDDFNTCHPATGYWSSRLLTVDEYRQIVQPYGCALEATPGFFDEASWLNRRRNRRLRRRRRFGRAPFLIFSVTPASQAREASQR